MKSNQKGGYESTIKHENKQSHNKLKKKKKK
jgi:hypothetical protein